MFIDNLKAKLNDAIAEQSLTESAKLCRELLELCINYIFERSNVFTNAQKPKTASLLELIDSPTIVSYINDPEIISGLHYVRIVGMNALHGRSVRKKEVKLAQNNISYLVDLIESNESIIKSRAENIIENKVLLCEYKKPPYMSEATTRKLYIDLYLKEAGWDVLDIENTIMPSKACIEIKVSGMPNAQGIGFCDYVLYGKNGKPLAIIEAKKTSVSPEIGRHQVDLYGQCMEKIYGYKPILYYSNGYKTRIIDGIYPDRDVTAFHSLEELELMIQRRSRNNITDLKIKDEITNRPYQKIAITKLCEWLNSKHRRGLLVMATGTGKTRVSISLVDILSRNGWVKNALFLADRTALVNQAKRNFAKLLPDMSVCELSANGFANGTNGAKDYNARLMFCTYQTMINYIDAEDKRFTTGRFDIIIIDEAHRSIFNRYGTIFKYFDSFLIGLTATPKEEVDANTYHIFGCEAGMPNYDYTLENAIHDKYLVGYNVINRTSEMLSNGIDLKKLSDDEFEQLEGYLEENPPTPDFNIPGNEIFKYLFNKDTCRKVLEDLMRYGLRVDGGETVGKTIIFAYNHKHAQMIVDCFHEMYPEYSANTCQLIDYSVSYGDDLVIKFEEDPEFRIAVSVDMLDTGVDIPEVLNLVFFKKVRSRIKFVQMIGRGTRLCENIYGFGKHKAGFQIFDYCGNFEYFDKKPDGKPSQEMLTLSQRLFNIRVDMLYELQRLEYQQDEWLFAYYEKIKTELHNTIVKIKSHDSRIQVREAMQYVDKYYNLDTWTSLSPVMVKELNRHITPLIDSGLNGDAFVIAFDVRMYCIEHDLLKTGKVTKSTKHIQILRLIAKYLITEKASVPQVRDKADDLKRFMSEELWENAQRVESTVKSTAEIAELEKLRISLRDLMKYLKGAGKQQFEIDITDEIEDDDYQPENTTIDIRTYREKVIDYLLAHSDNPAIKKIHNLEPINNDDLQELENILWHELGSHEDYKQTTDIENLAAFVRSLIGLSQESVNEKFGEYLNGNTFNSQQQEFILTIINYVRENGDIELSDIVNTEPFNNYDLNEMFGVKLRTVIGIVNILHNSVVAEAA